MCLSSSTSISSLSSLSSPQPLKISKRSLYVSSFQYSDMWAVSLDNLFKVEMKGVEQNRAHACQLILRNKIPARSRWEDILERTWCLEQYQSFRFCLAKSD